MARTRGTLAAGPARRPRSRQRIARIQPPRPSQLMERYADRPMDLADATLVALAEEREIARIFTLDTDFHIYRIKGPQTLRSHSNRPLGAKCGPCARRR